MKAKAEVKKIVPEAKNTGDGVLELGRRVWLAGLGAAALTQEEMVHLYKRMLERGMITEKETRQWVKTQREKMAARRKQAAERSEKSLKKAESQVDAQVQTVLNKLGVPTKADLDRMDLPSRADIEALSEKVSVLTKKVEQLRKSEEQHVKKVDPKEVLPA